MSESQATSNLNLPNVLTTLRIAMVPFFGWALLVDGGDSITWRIVAAVIFVSAMITDKIDGDIARARNLVTNFGKIADPIADKAITGMAFVGLSVLGELPWWITIPVLVREWGITAMRFFIIRHSVMPAGQGGKTKTALQALALGFFIAPLWTLPEPDVWMWVAWIIMAAAVILTLVTGIDIALKGRRLRQTSERTRRKRAERLARRAGGR